jgi:hypothetical protein
VKTFIFEGVQNYGVPLNWGKFLVGVPDVEWFRESQVDPHAGRYPLLEQIGWTQAHVWVMDLQTGEGAWFRPGGSARADLEKHRIWVCPLFEEFLKWLYAQDISRLNMLPGVIELPDARFSINGYRRPGPHDVSFTLRKGDLMKIEWGGEPRIVVCDGFTRDEEAVIRSLTEAEIENLGRHTEAAIEAQQDEEPAEDDPAAWTDGDPAEHPYPEGSFSLPKPEDVTAELLAAPDTQDTQETGPDDVPTQVIDVASKGQAGS